MATSSGERSEIGKENGNDISREAIQAAIAKAVELRAIHAALMQGNSPSNLRLPLPSASTVSVHTSSAQDYPVFNPSYDDEPLPGYHQKMLENRKYAESWGDYAMDVASMDETTLSERRTVNASLLKGLMPSQTMCPAEDQDSVAGFQQAMSPGPDCSKARRNSLGDVKSVSSYNKCKPTTSSYDSDGVAKNGRKSNAIVPMANAQSSLNSQARNKGLSFSWLFPKLKKKSKNESFSPVRPESEDMSQKLNDLGMLSVETLKKELIEAQGSRDAALIEVSEMKSSLGELSHKLEYLETYCEELKKALRQAVHMKISLPREKLAGTRGKAVDGNAENSMPVSDEAMVEGFLQVVSESRLSVKQFCKALIGQIPDTNHVLLDNLNTLLQPYKLSLNSKHSKAVFYHLEAIINRLLYQDFENCVFERDGVPKLLDPHQERRSNFQLFITLRNLNWNEVLRKGTKYYNHEFNKFCDQKMGGIIAALGWTKPWPEQLLQAFFVAVKCIWLLHSLAFSFDPPLGILRVDENRVFEPHYMDDISADKQRPLAPSRVKIMVMPGFYVHDKVLRCKVLCRYK